MRRFSALFLFSIALLVSILEIAIAAPVQTSNTHRVTLRLVTGPMGIPLKGASSPWDRASREVFEYFKRQHPEIDFVPATGIQVQGPASESSLPMSMAGGTAPDVIYVNFRKLETFISQGFLYPLDDYIKQDPQILRGVHPQIKQVINVDGHIYSVPFFQCVMALYYRKDLFRDAGLDPNKPPKNWDEFYSYAQKLTDPDKGRWGMVFYSTPQGRAFHWTNLLRQAGGDVLKKENGEWRSSFNTPEGVTALKFYKKLVADPWTKNGKTVKGVAEVTTNALQDIERGKVGMWFSYSYELETQRQNINPSLLGIAPLPAGPAGHANEINAGMWGINSQIKDKRVRDAAWEYIKFMSSEEATRVRTKAYVEAGLWKMVNPVHLIKFGYKEYASGIPKSWVEANREAFKYGRPEPHGKNCEMIYTELDVPLQTVEQYPDANLKKVLDTAAYKIDTKMLGYTPPGEMKRKRSLAWTAVIAMLILVGGLGTRQVRMLAKAHSDDSSETGVAGRSGLRTQVIAWTFMLPAVASILIWAYYPLLRGMVMAFQDYKVLGGSHFIGLDNFIEVMGQQTFWWGMLNSFFYVGLNLALGFMLPIILALMLSEIPRGKMLYRTLYYLPAITSGLVIVFLWKWFYDPTPQGLFNVILEFMHIPAQTWLQDPKLAMLCVVLPGVWAGAGPGSIIYLAALKSIPEEMYEAADIDGAGVFTKMWRITLPMLKPLILINFVGAFIGSFKAMENVFVMTGGGPLYRTHTIGLEIWYNAFMYLKYGYATAAAWIMGSILIGFTMYQLRILRDVKFSASGRED